MQTIHDRQNTENLTKTGLVFLIFPFASVSNKAGHPTVTYLVLI
jgi:hypothetical protein